LGGCACKGATNHGLQLGTSRALRYRCGVHNSLRLQSADGLVSDPEEQRRSEACRAANPGRPYGRGGAGWVLGWAVAGSGFRWLSTLRVGHEEKTTARPRKRKAPMGVERKDNVVDLYSSLPRASQRKGFAPRPRSQPLPRPDGTDEAANRTITNGRRWMIFAGFIILRLLLASVAVLFATHWS
jgi:hypothetical protein